MKEKAEQGIPEPQKPKEKPKPVSLAHQPIVTE